MDKISPKKRSENMRAIRSENTKPEVRVRKAAHAMGYRFRLHRRDLPGKPDLVFAGRQKLIFVHGCFWHQHEKCRDGRVPLSNSAYWRPKLARNVARDAENAGRLKQDEWKVLVIWECETDNKDWLTLRLRSFLG